MTRIQKEETFQFPVPCPHSASNHAHRPLFCSSLLLLSFLSHLSHLSVCFTRKGEHLHPEDQWGSEDIGLQRAAQLSRQGRQLVATSCLTLQEGGTQEKDVRAVTTTVDGSCSPPGTARPPCVDCFYIPFRGHLST